MRRPAPSDTQGEPSKSRASASTTDGDDMPDLSTILSGVIGGGLVLVAVIVALGIVSAGRRDD